MLDRNGKLWAGTRGGLALMRDAPAGGRCGVERVYRDKSGLLNISALAQGPDGTIWMGTALGISRLQPYAADVRFQDFTRANGLTDRYIYSLAVDRFGNVWAGTEGAGVMRIQAGGFTTFGERDGLASDRVSSVFADAAGRLLAVTWMPRSAWLNVFDGSTFHGVVPGVFGEKPHVGKPSDTARKPQRRMVGGNRGGPLPLCSGEGLGPGK